MAAEEKVIENVQMEDGRTVSFAGKRKMLKEIIVHGSEVGVRFDFRSGNTRTFKVPSQHMLYSAGHGYAQKLGDTVAGLKDEHGNPADEDDMLLEVEGLHEKLVAGDWNSVRSGGGFAGLSVLAKALMELTGKDAAAIKDFLSKRSMAEKQALRSSDKLSPIIVRLEANKIKKASKVDTETLLSSI